MVFLERDSWGSYKQDRWRWHEILDAAIAMYRRWGIRTGMRTSIQAMLVAGVKIRADQWDVVREAGL